MSGGKSMAKRIIDKDNRELIARTEEGRAYIEYNNKVGGEPIGLCVPYGYPKGVEKLGGVIAVYEECIRQGKTWEELLDFKHAPKDAII
jgi:hypothetical protein